MASTMERNQKLEQQRQLMEQKMRQKRQTTGMIQASDFRSKSAKSRSSSANRRELHGYDGPMQYSMSKDNPDQVISIAPTNSDNDEDMTVLNSPPQELLDVEDDESTPVPLSPDNGLNSPMISASEQPIFLNHTSIIETEGDVEGNVDKFVLEPAQQKNEITGKKYFY
ncbi:king tubby [Carabus blaptoides fortunei]